LKAGSGVRDIPHGTVKFRGLVTQDDLSVFEYAFAIDGSFFLHRPVPRVRGGLSDKPPNLKSTVGK